MWRPHVRLVCTATVAVIMLGSQACGHQRSSTAGTPSRSGVITAADIERSGAKNAWEALRRHGGNHLLIRENARSDDARITHRGANSLLLSNQILVIVDGVHLTGWSYLREIPAFSVADIRIMSAREATLKYGTPAGNGAVVVRTRPPGAAI